MAPSSPHSQSKHQEPRVVDLEDGNQISRGPLEPGESSESTTPDTRLSQEYDDASHHNRSAVAFRWQKVWNRIPQPVASRLHKAVDWIKGPQPARVYHIKPLFEPIQTFPARLVARLPKTARIGLLFTAFALWVVLFAVILSKFGNPNDIAGFGPPVKLSCTNRLWYVEKEPPLSKYTLTQYTGLTLRVVDSTVEIVFLSTI